MTGGPDPRSLAVIAPPPDTSDAAGRSRQRLLDALPSVEERHLEVGGIATAVLEGGTGSPLVLLHGAGEFAATWAPVLPALTRDHRVIVPDLPGHGASATHSALDAADVVTWLEELLDATCAHPPVVIGHLLGGGIALRVASRDIATLQRLVLVDTLGLAPYRPAPSFALALAGFMLRPTQRSRDRMFQRCFLDLDAVQAEAGELWPHLAAYALDRARSPELKRTLRQLMPELGAALPPEQLAAIAAPTTLIHGRHDRQVRLTVAQSASDRYGWPLYVIEDAADDPAVEQPDRFLAALRTAVADAAEER